MLQPRPTELASLHARIWSELERAAQDRGHAWRTPALATIGGDFADARTVVLREVDEAGRRLCFYSDQRAAKVVQLLHHPHGTMLMWSAALGWQLRCRVHLSLETSGTAIDSTWARLQLTPAAQDYLAPLPPGSQLDGPYASRGNTGSHSHFAVIQAYVAALDWLELHADGHRRAVFDDDGARWVQP